MFHADTVTHMRECDFQRLETSFLNPKNPQPHHAAAVTVSPMPALCRCPVEAACYQMKTRTQVHSYDQPLTRTPYLSSTLLLPPPPPVFCSYCGPAHIGRQYIPVTS
jgi:hypothetical protein